MCLQSGEGIIKKIRKTFHNTCMKRVDSMSDTHTSPNPSSIGISRLQNVGCCSWWNKSLMDLFSHTTPSGTLVDSSPDFQNPKKGISN